MAKYTKEILEKAAKNSTSVAGMMRRLGLRKWAGGTHAHLSRKVREFGIDTSHFLGQAYLRGGIPPNKLSPDKILVKREAGTRAKRSQLKRAMLESGVSYRCDECGQGPEWREKTLTLPVDHINGDFLDDRLENLRFLCPSCHSQTATFGRGRQE